MTGILSAKNDELHQLASRLQASSATLEDAAVKQSLNSDSAGFVELSQACGEFVSNAAKRVQGGQEWFDKVIDGVEFTARHIGQTDAQIAQSIVKTSRSFSDVVFSLEPLLWSGKFGWDGDAYQENG